MEEQNHAQMVKSPRGNSLTNLEQLTKAFSNMP